MPSNLFITTDKVTFSGLNMICNRMNCKKYPILCNCSQASNWLEGSRTAPELPPPSLSFDYSSNFRFFFNFKFWNLIELLLKYHIPLFHWALLQIFNFSKFSNIWICNFLGHSWITTPSLLLDPYSTFSILGFLIFSVRSRSTICLSHSLDLFSHFEFLKITNLPFFTLLGLTLDEQTRYSWPHQSKCPENPGFYFHRCLNLFI